MLTYYESGELPPFGRVLRGADGRVCDIREYKDASEAERAVRELNGGVYVFGRRKALRLLTGAGAERGDGRILPHRRTQAAAAARRTRQRALPARHG